MLTRVKPHYSLFHPPLPSPPLFTPERAAQGKPFLVRKLNLPDFLPQEKHSLATITHRGPCPDTLSRKPPCATAGVSGPALGVVRRPALPSSGLRDPPCPAQAGRLLASFTRHYPAPPEHLGSLLKVVMRHKGNFKAEKSLKFFSVFLIVIFPTIIKDDQ